jgi:hypothetical protein
LSDARAVIVQHPDIVLRMRVTLLCRAPIPLQGLGIILPHAFAMGVHHAEVALRPCIAVFRQGSKKRQRGWIILALIGGHCILKGASDCGTRQRQHQRDQIPTP